ncbi:MAG: hypothetical protein LBT04_07870 [Prevotellaceae bacterium]|nr:hypothetical protein [Prevotellaceae bacterium]
MKKLAFLSTLAVVALLTSCNEVPVPSEQKPDFTIQYVNNEGNYVDLKGGETVIIDHYEDYGSGSNQLKFDGKIFSKESFALEVLITRESILTGTTDELCVVTCIAGNGEPTQLLKWDITEEEQGFYADCTSQTEGDNTITYKFYDAAKKDVSIAVKVIYKYYLDSN